MLTQGLWMDLLPKSSHVHSLGCERGFHLRLREGAGIGDMWRCTECYNIGIAICRRSPQIPVDAHGRDHVHLILGRGVEVA